MISFIISVLAASAISALPVVASDARDQLAENVRVQLPFYATDVDVASLSTSQLGAISMILHGDHTEGYKRAMIRSVIGGQHSLRGILFN